MTIGARARCLLRGLHCAFCRRHIAQLAVTREKLQDVGVETLAIVASPLERARLYLRFRPTKVLLAADPEMVTHRSYGLPKVEASPDRAQRLKSMYLDLTREMNDPLPETASMTDIVNTVGRLDGFEMTQADWDDRRRHQGQLVAQFLLDRHGVVRWVNVEGAREGLAGLGKFPTDDELLNAARGLPSYLAHPRPS